MARAQVAIERSSTSAHHLHGQVAIERPIVAASNLKGQVATEFFIYAGIFLVLVIAAVSIINFTQSSEVASLQYGVAKEYGQFFADAVNLAVRGGQGFTYIFNFQPKVLGYPYVIHFSEGFVYMMWEGPQGNFTYAYNIAHYGMMYNICSPGGSKLISDKGVSKLNFTNDGNTITITQECA